MDEEPVSDGDRAARRSAYAIAATRYAERTQSQPANDDGRTPSDVAGAGYERDEQMSR